MHLVKMRADTGYWGGRLWLPRRFISTNQLKSALTYIHPGGLVEAWEDCEDHIAVPRHFLPGSVLAKLPFEVKDIRPQSFPRVDFTSNVVLDAKVPALDIQKRSVDALLHSYDGILCLRCGAGKTVVGLDAASRLHVPVLIVVQDMGLASQWELSIEKFTNIRAEDVGHIGDGKFDWEHPITIAIVNTLAGRATTGTLPPEMLHHFGLVLVDECHTMAAPWFNRAIPPFAGRRWGLSATPDRNDGMDSLLYYTFGDIVYSYLLPELMPTVYFRRLETRLNLSDPTVRTQVIDKARELNLGKLYKYFGVTDKQRTQELVKDIRNAVKSGRQVLVLTHSRATIEELLLHLPDAGVCHGDTKGDVRIQNLLTKNPVIAIMRLGRQALDKESLDTIFICEPTTKEGVMQQIMGRALRTFAGKKDPTIIIYEDLHIDRLRHMCNKIRRLLTRWPEEKGGQIKYIDA